MWGTKKFLFGDHSVHARLLVKSENKEEVQGVNTNLQIDLISQSLKNRSPKSEGLVYLEKASEEAMDEATPSNSYFRHLIVMFFCHVLQAQLLQLLSLDTVT